MRGERRATSIVGSADGTVICELGSSVNRDGACYLRCVYPVTNMDKTFAPLTWRF